MLSEDGWVKTGDIFQRDEQDYYYFVDRKRLLIRYLGYFVSIKLNSLLSYFCLPIQYSWPINLNQKVRLSTKTHGFFIF